MASGRDLVDLASRHIGERYANVLVPKSNARWTGPWDCAEFASWCVFQVADVLFGCIDDHVDPAVADAYTGAWERDGMNQGEMIAVDRAASIAGAVVLRYPPMPGAMGHIAFCDGRGGTVEAHSTARGVISDVSPPMAGLEVRTIQERLQALRIDPGPIDGEFGPLTHAAVVAFQQLRSLVPDGEVGPHTAAALGITLRPAR
jgi:N-acetylmuramoyl-L-alanine amidase